jgi:hypothetical protein
MILPPGCPEPAESKHRKERADRRVAIGPLSLRSAVAATR